MELIRAAASRGLEAREKAGIKIRQPLAQFKAKSLPQDTALRALIADELNVKRVLEDASLAEDVQLDITITPELREEGMVRGLMRRVQEWRKAENLSINDRPHYTLLVSAEEKEVAEKYRDEIMQGTGLKSLDISIGA